LTITLNKRLITLFAFSIGSIIIIALALFIVGNPGQKLDYLFDNEWSLDVELKDSTVISFNMTDLIELDHIERYYFLFRGGEDKENQEGIFRGVSLKYFINDILNVSDYEYVSVIAIDTYSMSVAKTEIESEEDIIIAYIKDGEYLKGPKDGGNGPLRLIIPQQFDGDLNALRCVKFVSRLKFL